VADAADARTKAVAAVVMHQVAVEDARILIWYDGSSEAQHAVDVSAVFFRGAAQPC
jgi:hypothetical protein